MSKGPQGVSTAQTWPAKQHEWSADEIILNTAAYLDQARAEHGRNADLYVSREISRLAREAERSTVQRVSDSLSRLLVIAASLSVALLIFNLILLLARS